MHVLFFLKLLCGLKDQPKYIFFGVISTLCARLSYYEINREYLNNREICTFPGVQKKCTKNQPVCFLESVVSVEEPTEAYIFEIIYIPRARLSRIIAPGVRVSEK